MSTNTPFPPFGRNSQTKPSGSNHVETGKRRLNRHNILRILNGWQISQPSRSQEDRALRALQLLGDVTTSELRDGLGIMHPAGCIHVLRSKGFEINTKRQKIFAANGRVRYVARYVFVRREGADQ